MEDLRLLNTAVTGASLEAAIARGQRQAAAAGLSWAQTHQTSLPSKVPVAWALAVILCHAVAFCCVQSSRGSCLLSRPACSSEQHGQSTRCKPGVLARLRKQD